MSDDAKHCPGCGIEIRPQALTPLPEDRACPRCKRTLQHRALGISTVIECSVCGGLWLEARVFEAVVRDTERELDGFLSGLHAPAERPRTLDRQGYIPCLTCGELMLRRQFRHRSRASGVVVDTCRGHGPVARPRGAGAHRLVHPHRRRALRRACGEGRARSVPDDEPTRGADDARADVEEEGRRDDVRRPGVPRRHVDEQHLAVFGQQVDPPIAYLERELVELPTGADLPGQVSVNAEQPLRAL